MEASIPRRSITLPFLAGSKEKLAEIENMLAYGSALEIYVPLWHSLSRLASGTNGTATINCPTAGCDFDQVQKLALFAPDMSRYAVRPILSVGASQITLGVTLDAGLFPVGSLALPVIAATPAAANEFEWSPPVIGQGVVEFTEIDQ
jgi:hypothetical protein